MSTVLVQRVIEIYHSNGEPHSAYTAQLSTPHERLLPNLERITIRGVSAKVIDSNAIFNPIGKTFTYVYTVQQEVIVINEDVELVEERLRFALANKYEGWTLNIAANYDNFIYGPEFVEDATLRWDAQSLIPVE